MKNLGATLLRLILGVVYLMHAYLSFVVLTPAGTIAVARQNGIPFPEVAVGFAILAHAGGGTALILGLWTRWAALVNVPVMAGALYFVHLKQGFFMTGMIVDAARGVAVAGGYEYVLVLLVATVAQIFLGGGTLALTRDR